MAGMLIFLFLACITLANLAVTYLDPVPVGFGLYAPAGVYFVAITLVLRDLVQRFHGRLGLSIALIGGVALSYAFASSQVVSASLVAFAVSFVVDTLIFTAVYHWWHRSLPTAVLVSGLISLIPDSVLFLWLIDGLEFLPGQLVGKTLGTLAAFSCVWAINHAMPDKREVQHPSVPFE